MDLFAATCERLAATSSRNSKIRILADYLRPLADDDLTRAVRFFSGSPLAATDHRQLSVGHSTLREAVMQVTGWDKDIIRVCHRTVGDTGETLAALLHGFARGEDLSLAAAEEHYLALQRTRKTAHKVAHLVECFTRYRPSTLKYFIKVITRGMRIGLQEKMVVDAVASATGADTDAVRAANHRAGNLAQVALAARAGTLESISARLFHPMDFMLARPLDSLFDLGDPALWAIEDKYDGIRAQLHLQAGEIRIYTRGLEDATPSYPDLSGKLWLGLPDCILDGELMAWKDGRALHFNVLQQRLARKRPSARLITDIPVVFMAYDLLYLRDDMVLHLPLEARRAALEAITQQKGYPLLLSPRHEARSLDDVEQLFRDARDRGNEGLVLKRRGSPYEMGKRSGTWYKLKRPLATLDVVITAAEQGHGKRATVLSDYTFAVREGDRFLNVGKAYSGLTDAEIRELTRLLRALVTERFSRVLLVKPEIVLEVAFDGIQKSPRHKSGYAMRFPRIVRWRRDKTATDIDTLDRVREIYEHSLGGMKPGAAAPEE
ncbi:MAG: cisplatin damage response ATP-dependent DNA ligase [Bryobacterales bacterium]|nr:cisplatin damage response ATP-dependent DNA ligase [Bryobacterales bacterium]